MKIFASILIRCKAGTENKVLNFLINVVRGGYREYSPAFKNGLKFINLATVIGDSDFSLVFTANDMQTVDTFLADCIKRPLESEIQSIKTIAGITVIPEIL